MKWLQAIQNKLPQHKYAINAKLLGDDRECAWTNLGYWDDATSSYPMACEQLAEHLAQAVQLQPQDRVLDLGCGQGASLKYWREHYQIQDLEAVELQQDCVDKINKHIQLKAIHCQSFLNLKQIPFPNQFDVVICIDAAYHSDLNVFLNATHSVLKSNGRLGFHYLMLSDQSLSAKQKIKYAWLLKAADVTWEHLKNEQQLLQTLTQHGWSNIVIQDFSTSVLNGFAEYIEIQKMKKKSFDLEQLKIEMTAKLCRKFYQDGLVRYIQVSATKK